MPPALEHLRVIDASQVMAGPYCALLLADFGCEVERLVGLVDGALLLVVSSEGTLSESRFVLR